MKQFTTGLLISKKKSLPADLEPRDLDAANFVPCLVGTLQAEQPDFPKRKMVPCIGGHVKPSVPVAVYNYLDGDLYTTMPEAYYWYTRVHWVVGRLGVPYDKKTLVSSKVKLNFLSFLHLPATVLFFFRSKANSVQS